jgi:hypothetical protein
MLNYRLHFTWLSACLLGSAGVEAGLTATYLHERPDTISESVVKSVTLTFGPNETRTDTEYQWLHFRATKTNGRSFAVWFLSAGYPSDDYATALKKTARYIIQEGDAEPLEFRNRRTGGAVLPVLGGWAHLVPQPTDGRFSGESVPRRVTYLGHAYVLDHHEREDRLPTVPTAKVIELTPDVLIGVPSNRTPVDGARYYDRRDLELTPLTRDHYDEMIDAGLNCFRVDPEQAKWLARRNVYTWGVGGASVPYPECLYRSNYLGPAIFFDEPAVHLRDQILRPRLAKDPAFRKAISPQVAFDEFKKLYGKERAEGSATALLRQLSARPDVDLGDMEFLQRNLYSWETMVGTSAYQMTLGGDAPPAAIVFEPPGRVGTLRNLPELNMAYGCQIPVDNPHHLTSILYGFLRGAARLSGREWGTSIYGAVDRTDAFWFLTHAYDLGATHFFFWDYYQLAGVPYGEILALSRNLRAHTESYPDRNLNKLRESAEVAILLPPGYNLGHVHLGKGNLWGVGELNLERVNREGVKYRVVMHNFFIEIERCIRLGVAFDLLWDLDRELPGYREIVRVREDGKVELERGDARVLLNGPRTPDRPEGVSPQLSVTLSSSAGRAPMRIIARATVVEGSAPVFYTTGTDSRGVYNNLVVFWELYGPEEEDYRPLMSADSSPRVERTDTGYHVETDIRIERPGQYRLRASAVDRAGRTVETWSQITVEE